MLIVGCSSKQLTTNNNQLIAFKISFESVTKPKHCLTLYSVANQQYSGEVVAVQSLISMQSYPKKLASCRVAMTHWSALTPVKNKCRSTQVPQNAI